MAEKTSQSPREPIAEIILPRCIISRIQRRPVYSGSVQGHNSHKVAEDGMSWLVIGPGRQNSQTACSGGISRFLLQRRLWMWFSNLWGKLKINKWINKYRDRKVRKLHLGWIYRVFQSIIFCTADLTTQAIMDPAGNLSLLEMTPLKVLISLFP